MLDALSSEEQERLEVLFQYKILDTGAEKDFDDLIRIASQICGTPIALISLLDRDRQWFKARIGLAAQETPREQAFCHFTIMQNELLIVEDATKDIRFSQNPLVLGEPSIRFYAGSPLITYSGHKLGTLCVIDTSPRKLTAEQQYALKTLTNQLVHLLEMRLQNEKLVKRFMLGFKQQGELLEIKRNLSSILNSTKDHHYLISDDYKLLSFNKAAKRFVNKVFHQELAIGQDFRAYIPASMEAEFKKNFEKACKGHRVSIERAFEFKPGKYSWQQMDLEPVYDDRANLTGISFNIVDINKKKRSELLIKYRNAQLKEIASMQSHKIRRPVAAILGLLQLVDKISLTTENKKLFNLLEITAQELDEVIHQIVEKADSK